MASKKSKATVIGLALLVYGITHLLVTLGIWRGLSAWWLPLILIVTGLYVLVNNRGTAHILGWICLVYGALLAMMVLDLFYISLLLKLTPATWILFGLILLL